MDYHWFDDAKTVQVIDAEGGGGGGETGGMHYAGTYDAGANYKADDVVDLGNQFILITADSPGSAPIYVALSATAAYVTSQFSAHQYLIYGGVWASDSTYAVGSVVSYNGGLYAAVANTTVPSPVPRTPSGIDDSWIELEPAPALSEVTTDYTLVLTDTGTLIAVTDASAATVTVPVNTDVAFLPASTIRLAQIGAGAVTVAGAVGVTLIGASLSTAAVGDVLTLTALGDLNHWLVNL
jgi:hypothetical protein